MKQVHGKGIRHRLQGYVPELGAVVPNAFDVDGWKRASSLHAFGMELFVQTGEVTVSLRHFLPDGSEREYCRLTAAADGPAYTPPIFVGPTEGLLLPVIEQITKGAVFDIYFGTNEAPLLSSAKTAFVIEAEDPAATEDAFRRFQDEHEQHGAREAARLVLVDGPQGIGRGLYATCYGDMADEGFTHVSLLKRGARRAPHPEMFARVATFMRFMRPDAHVGAAVYDTAWAVSGLGRCQQIGVAGMPEDMLPAPPPAGSGLSPKEPAAFASVPRHDVLASWDWACFDVRSLHRSGLPIPLNETLAEREFSARLRKGGAIPAIPLSFWSVRSKAPDAPAHPEDELAIRALAGYFSSDDQLRLTAVTSFHELLGAGDVDGMLDLFDGMGGLCGGMKQLVHRKPYKRRPPFRLGFRSLRLKRSFRQHLHLLEECDGLTDHYRGAREAWSTIAFWDEMVRRDGEVDVTGWTLSDAAIRQQRELAALHLKSDGLFRVSEQARTRDVQRLEARLQENGLLDRARTHADLDRANRIMLSLLRNRHEGRRAVVVGNGPSLGISDLDRLRGEVTFASNKIYLAFDETAWRPTYYSVEDHLVILNNWDRIVALDGCIKIFPANVRDFGFHEGDTIFVPFRPPKSFDDPLSDPEFPDFSHDLSHGICWGSSIVYSQIQMALHMGCSEIILIGVDHMYELPSVKHGRHYLHEGERNHFHPQYRVIGEKWHQPNLDVLEMSYARARDQCAARGVAVLNASRATALDVFERVDFDTLFPPPDQERD